MAMKPGGGGRYIPPPDGECDALPPFFIYPTGSDNDPHRLVVRMKLYRGLIVDFSINQTTLIEQRWRDVARIDCCGGVIHRHQYDIHGNDLIGHKLIEKIPSEGGWEVVNKGYLTAYDVMHDEWENNLRRWRDGRA